MLTARDRLLAPRSLPDGSVEWTEHVDITRKLREGDATLGWGGDERLALIMWPHYHDSRDGYDGPAFALFQRLDDGSATCLCVRKGAHVPGDELIRWLVAHDAQRVDVGALVVAENAALDRDRQREFDDYTEDKADKLRHALVKDLNEPAPAGRIYGTGR